MRNILIKAIRIPVGGLLLVLIVCIHLGSCVSLKRCNEKFPPKTQRMDSIIREITYLKKDSIIKIPSDSAWYYALVECIQDKNGRWVPSVTEQTTNNGSRIKISSQVSDGKLIVKCKEDSLNNRISWLEKQLKESKTIIIRESYPVEEKIGWWKQTMIIGGYILLGMIILLIIYFILKVKKIIKF